MTERLTQLESAFPLSLKAISSLAGVLSNCDAVAPVISFETIWC